MTRTLNAMMHDLKEISARTDRLRGALQGKGGPVLHRQYAVL
jgi:hypothetical protein